MNTCEMCGCDIADEYRRCYQCHMKLKRGGWHEPERLPHLEIQDAGADRDYRVYVLKTDEGYYVGHSGNTPARLNAHMRGEVPSTAGKNPQFVWGSYRMKSRDDAKRYEAALKSWRDTGNEKFYEQTGLPAHYAGEPETTGCFLRLVCGVVIAAVIFFAYSKITSQPAVKEVATEPARQVAKPPKSAPVQPATPQPATPQPAPTKPKTTHEPHFPQK